MLYTHKHNYIHIYIYIYGYGSIGLERPLTEAQCKVEDAKPNVHPEEEDAVGHFAEH